MGGEARCLSGVLAAYVVTFSHRSSAWMKDFCHHRMFFSPQERYGLRQNNAGVKGLKTCFAGTVPIRAASSGLVLQ